MIYPSLNLLSLVTRIHYTINFELLMVYVLYKSLTSYVYITCQSIRYMSNEKINNSKDTLDQLCGSISAPDIPGLKKGKLRPTTGQASN